MTNWVRLLAGACLAIVATVGCTGSGAESAPATVAPPQCLIASDCPAGDICVLGYCTVQCKEGRDCPAGQQCQSGACVAAAAACATPCAADESCVAGQCIQCKADVDCGDGKTCASNRCVDTSTLATKCTHNSDCASPLLCIGGVCDVQCKGDVDCASDETCVSTHCSPKGTPAPVQCQQNSDCKGSGESCVNNACVVPCTTDGECKAGRVCHQNQCVVQSCQTTTDCDAGRYCSLLQACVYDCRADDDCSKGQACDARGRCQSSLDAGTVSQLAQLPVPAGILTTSADTLLFPTGKTTESITLSNTGAGPLSWSIDPATVPDWLRLSPMQGTLDGQTGNDAGIVTAQAEVHATILSAKLPPADVSAAIDVVSDGGRFRMTVGTGSLLDGVYSGHVYLFVDDTAGVLGTAVSQIQNKDAGSDLAQLRTIEGAATLGSLDLSLWLKQSGSTLTGTLDPDSSPAFPTRTAVSGSTGTGSTTLTFTITTPIGGTTNTCPIGDTLDGGAPDGCVRDNPMPLPTTRAVTRTIQISSTQFDRYRIRGRYTETITGLRGAAIKLDGYVVLRRTRDLAHAEPSDAGSPLVEPPPPETIDGGLPASTPNPCSGLPASPTTLAEAISNVTQGQAPTKSFACRDLAAVDAGTVIVDGGCSGATDAGQQPYVARECAAGEPSSNYCYKTAQLENAFAYLRCEASKSPTNATIASAYLNAFDALMTVYTMRGNDAIAKALDRQWVTQSTPIDEEIADLSSAIAPDAAFGRATNLLYTNLPILETIPENTYAGRQYIDFVLGARMASRDSLARSEKSMRLVRKGQTRSAVSEIRENLMKAYFQAVVTGSILADRSVPLPPDFDSYRLAIRDAQRELQKIRQGLNPVGYADSYVPFYFRSEEVGSMGANNFSQLFSFTKDTLLQRAVRTENDALVAKREYEMTLKAYQQQMLDAQTRYDDQIFQLCGTTLDKQSGSTPDQQADNLMKVCGLSGGDIYSQSLSIQQARLRVQQASARVAALNDRVRIEGDRVSQILEVNYGFTNAICKVEIETGKALAANDVAQASLRQQQAAEQEQQQADSSMFGSFLGLAGAVVATAVTGGAAVPALVAAGGSFLKAGMAEDSVGSSGQYYQREGQLAADRDNLQAQQSARVYYLQNQQQSQKEAIDSAAQIHSWLTEMRQLNLDTTMARLSVTQESARLRTMYEQVKRLLDDRRRATSLINQQSFQDPTQRLDRDATVVVADQAFEDALRFTYLTAKAYEYETNQPYPPLATLFSIRSAAQAQDHGGLDKFLSDIKIAYADFRASVGNPQPRQDVISIREDILGLKDPVYLEPCSTLGVDCGADAAGTCVQKKNTTELACQSKKDAKSLFQEVVLGGGHVDENGSLRFPFATSVAQGNPIFSSMVFNDRIKTLRVDLLGSRLGDEQAVVYVEQGGASFVRTPQGFGGSAQEEVRQWDVRPWRAAVAASQNGAITQPAEVVNNLELFGRSVAFANWAVVIDRVHEPRNADIDLSGLEDIRIIVLHEGYTAQDVQGQP